MTTPTTINAREHRLRHQVRALHDELESVLVSRRFAAIRIDELSRALRGLARKLIEVDSTDSAMVELARELLLGTKYDIDGAAPARARGGRND